jgi:hypothetical protein
MITGCIIRFTALFFLLALAVTLTLAAIRMVNGQ